MSSERLIVVSGDCHADPASQSDFRPYVAEGFRETFDGWVAATEKMREMSMEQLFSGEHVDKRAESSGFEGTAEEMEQHRVALATGLSRTSDPDVRLKELAADGVVAEVIFPNGTPMMSIDPSSSDHDASDEGMMTYNRWLANLCGAHPGRHIGVAQIPPAYDVDQTVARMRSVRADGLRAMNCPSPTKGLPPLIDPYYEPIWEAAEELDLPLHAHIGWGGAFVDEIPFMQIMGAAARGVVMSEMRWLSRRCLWLLTFAGVFERHPGLKLVFVEQQADWVPNQLAMLDDNYFDFQRGHPIRAELPNPPSFYWNRQCFVCASSLSRAEAELRHDIGIDTLTFGTDYPHFEATWPNTKLWIKRALHGASADDIRKILGDNAIRCYGLDRDQLAAAAAECGPEVDDVLVGTDDIEDETAKWLDDRGLARPAICM